MEGTESEGFRRVEPSLGHQRAMQTRTYAICLRSVYSLRESALRLDLPEEMLRRAMFFEDILAMPVDDDRHYVVVSGELRRYVESLHPSDRCVFQCCGRFYWGM